MVQKFHINSAGDVRACNANIKPCRFSESDHFTDRAEARLKVEEKFSKELQPLTSQTKNVVDSQLLGTNSAKTISGEILHLRNSISKTAAKQTLTTDDFKNLGKLFEDIVKDEYIVDPFNKDLDHSEYVEIGTINRKVLGEILTTGSNLPNLSIDGTMKKSLEQSVAFLPDGAKDLIKSRYIQANRISGKKLAVGQHKYGQLKIPAEVKLTVNANYIPENANDGDLFIPKSFPKVSELLHPGNSTLLHVKNGNETKLKTYWLGKTLRDKAYSLKKISNSAIVFLNGEYVKVDKPLYEVSGFNYKLGSEISGPKIVNERIEAVWLHEYTHALQIQTRLPEYEEEMFNSIAGDKTFSFDYNEIVHKGFPNDYMGHKGKRELFPTATEALFYPNGFDREFFYGKERKENSDNLRQWTIGVWLTLGQK